MADKDKIETKPAPEKPAKVKVKAVVHLHEDDQHRNPGDIFEVAPARRAALGALVTDVK
jgi:hypothetical protein